jgi:hypothetical protein
MTKIKEYLIGDHLYHKAKDVEKILKKKDDRILELEVELNEITEKIRQWAMADGGSHSVCSCGYCKSLLKILEKR